MKPGKDKRGKGSYHLAVVWGLFALSLPSPAQPADLLREGRTQYRDLADKAHVYRLELPGNGPYRVTVEQLGRDVVVFLRRPDGEQVMAVNSPTGKWGPERVFPPSGSPLLLEIKPRRPLLAGQSSAYEVRLDRLEGPVAEVELALAAAHASYFKKNWQGAHDHLVHALENGASLRPETKAAALFAIGYCANLLSRSAQALEYYRQALILWEKLDRSFQRGRTLNAMGFAQQSLGNHSEALAHYQAALPLFRSTGDLSWQATVCANMGNVHDVLGEPKQAGDQYTRALGYFRQAGDHQREAWLLNNMGALFRRMGAWQEARDHYQRALVILAQSGDRRWQARTLNNLGFLYLNLGQAQKAAGFFEQALPIRREVGDKRGEAITLLNLGTVHRHEGRLQEALTSYRLALELQRTIADREGEARTLNALALTELALGNPEKVLIYGKQVLVLLEKVANRRLLAFALAHMGAAYLVQGDMLQAGDHLDRALALQRELRDPAGETEVLLLRARVARRLGRLSQAQNDLAAAVELVESQRTRIASTDLRISWFATVSACYEQLVDVLMAFHRDQPQGGYANQALLISERARARGLLELLRESGTELGQGIDPDLMNKRRHLLQQLSARSAAQLKLLAKTHKEAAARAAEKRLQETLIALDELDSQIRRANPHHTQLTLPDELSVDQIVRMVDADTLLLVYHLGEANSFLWAVRSDRIEAYQLPARAGIETEAREYHRHLSLVNPDARAEQLRLGASLSRILLGPVADLLQNRRLAIVADGALHYLPFAALPEPGQPARQPILLGHEVVMLPSLSVLSLARSKPHSQDGLEKFAILADPVFTARDSRLQDLRGHAQVAANATRSGDTPLAFSRLSASRREAMAIGALAGENRCLLALDFQASRETVLNGTLRAYDVIHFATHGLLNDVHPELSAIVLSLYNEAGQPCQGLLTLPDIFNLELDAELVVLSGCQTASGKLVRGEGLVGLARGFLHAGAERVVASSWRVEDRATAGLMRHFYSAMLRQGHHPAAALREAQLALRQKRRYRDPWYWASFSIHGDWR